MEAQSKPGNQDAATCPTAIKVAICLVLVVAVVSPVVDTQFWTHLRGHPVSLSEQIHSGTLLSSAAMLLMCIAFAALVARGKALAFYPLMLVSGGVFNSPRHTGFIWHHELFPSAAVPWVVFLGFLWLIFFALMAVGARRYFAFAEQSAAIAKG